MQMIKCFNDNILHILNKLIEIYNKKLKNGRNDFDLKITQLEG